MCGKICRGHSLGLGSARRARPRPTTRGSYGPPPARGPGGPAVVGPSTDDGADEVADPEAGAGDDAVDDAGCTSDLAPGDLRIDELMIESVLGAGDHGEWLEVTSAAACAVN